MPPSMISSMVVATASSMNLPCSETSRMSRAGTSLRISSMTFLAARVTRIVFAPDALRTRTPTLSAPLSRASPWRSRTESMTRPTSFELDDAAPIGRPEARLADLGDVRELAGDAEGVLEAAPADGPPLDIPVEVVEPLGDVFRGQAVKGDAGRIELDHDLPDVAARDLGLADAFDLLQAGLDDQLAEIPELARALRPGNGQDHDGPGRGVERDDDRRLGFPRDGLAAVIERLPRVEKGEVHVGAPGELEGQEREALARPRLDAPEARDAAGGRFEGHGDQRLHFLGRDARKPRDDRKARISDVGQEIHAELAQGHEPEQDDGQEEHGRGNRPADG